MIKAIYFSFEFKIDTFLLTGKDFDWFVTLDHDSIFILHRQEKCKVRIKYKLMTSIATICIQKQEEITCTIQRSYCGQIVYIFTLHNKYLFQINL